VARSFLRSQALFEEAKTILVGGVGYKNGLVFRPLFLMRQRRCVGG